jgi:benzoate-CoA ligase family protein
VKTHKNGCSFNLSEHLLEIDDSVDRVIFNYDGYGVSRSELYIVMAFLAASLRESGASESDRVLLLMLDTPALPAAFLACMAIGAIPVPLNPKISTEGLRHILHDSRARFAIIEADNYDTQREIVLSSPYMGREGIFVQDLYHHKLKTVERSFENRGIKHLINTTRDIVSDFGGYCYKKPQSTAFWQYSSGTTGLQKAIKHTQTGMLENSELFARRTLGIEQNDRIYSIPKMFFGYGLGNSLFFPMALGAQSLIDSVWPTPRRVLENIITYRPTIFFGVPAIYNALLDEDLGIKNKDLSSVRIWFSAGSSLPEQIYQRWEKRFGSAILDGIGATEVGHVFLSNSPNNHRAGSTGHPVEGYEARLLTECGNEADIGEQGVLLVKGPSLSSGYWESPENNRKIFCDGWYKTGDIFVRTKDGAYSFKGREDDLFKVNGRWVVPVEVENIIQQNFAKVKEAVLVGYNNAHGMTEPFLFVSSDIEDHETHELSDNILGFLSQSIEKHKRPRGCVVMKELPRNDNGKLLRSKLSTSITGNTD